MTYRFVVVGFFVGNIMKKQTNIKDENITIDSIAEQWVKLLLAHIEAKKQIINAPGKKYKEEVN